MTPAQKAAATRKRRAAAAKAAKTRKRRAAGVKAGRTKKRRAAGRKAAATRKKAAGGGKAAIRESALFRALAGQPGIDVWEDEWFHKGGWTYFWIVSEPEPGTIRNLAYVRQKNGRLERRTYDEAGDDQWVAAE